MVGDVDSSDARQKIDAICQLLSPYGKVAVAFSGGVDSSTLLHICRACLGPEKVAAYFCNSCLQSHQARLNARKIAELHFHDLSFIELEIAPLNNPKFIQNSRERCYICKRDSFIHIQDEMKKSGCVQLLDGTNADDLKEDRPGRRAARELGVLSPLAEVGMTKLEIREYAKLCGLINHDLASNSCLATRIEPGQTIEPRLLEIVEQGERYLISHGFTGTRVRVDGARITLEVLESDLKKVVKEPHRSEIINYFRGLGYTTVCLSLTGR